MSNDCQSMGSRETADQIIARMQRELDQRKKDYEELHNYVVNKVNVTTRQLTGCTQFKGRNQLKAADMNGYARVNKDMLNWKLRFNVLSHLKFFEGMQVTWQPKVKGSFSKDCARISPGRRDQARACFGRMRSCLSPTGC